MRRPAPVPDRLLAHAELQEALLDAQQCDAAGVGPARRAALRRAGLLATVVRGVHDAAPALDAAACGRAPWAGHDPDDHRRRRAAWIALLALGREHAVATGACALALLGVQGLPRSIRPEGALRDGSHRTPGGGVRVRCVVPDRVERVGRARVVDPVTALAQAVVELGRDHAVAVLDSAVQRHVIGPDGVDDVARLLHGRRGSRRVAEWWDLVDGRAQSPLETRARLQCRDAGLAPHDLQVPVKDADGRVLARGDLGWWLADGRLLVAEIDGSARTARPTRCTTTARARTRSWPPVRSSSASRPPTSAPAASRPPSPATSTVPDAGMQRRRVDSGGSAAGDAPRPARWAGAT
ncbi:conserved hypothetical protein [Cellulomonas flavigena DSM 20109]|uniref:Uncharacterized protein n=1 Tax=Cellulomonas flavigena (strain ATCC 482 / DSM 20109 / BCRC 11376 / JCM 18109 / NBRC 3775 / NCIMB 8073 / NRS 134) TaxID=446466 RepID=D5UII5_CELFN|nr:hypothetical protein [Cellulomonas flavigena]ADG73484.1 conserved hypothetical protein [Cellulomonas flavigena DSM 20109]